MQQYFEWLAAFLAALVAVGAAASAGGARADEADGVAAFAEYLGRYQRADGAVDLVYVSHGRVALRPILWTTPQYLHRVGPDSFAVDERTDRRVRFRRDSRGRVSAAEVSGIDGDEILPRVVGSEPLPVELLLLDRGEEAAEGFIAQGPCGVEAGIRFATRIVNRLPTHARSAVACLSAIVSAFPAAADAQCGLGDGLMLLGDRVGARGAYRAALALDPAHAEARRALDRLGAPMVEATPGWTVPFDLADLFRPPTSDEIRSVVEDWARRDLSPRDVEVVEVTQLDLGSVVADLRVVSHRVHGQRHFGAVIVPTGARPGSCPVIVEAKGVSWNYFPLDLRQVPYAPRVLGAEQRQFIYVLPSFRGETLLVGDRSYLSEGDRADGWDGAADDGIALLSAALTVTPEADPSRVCVLGKSRGGSVALLMGERDPRVDCVVDWAGPTDWFSLMAGGGWTQAELVKDGLRNRSAPHQVAGQFIERFLSAPISRSQGLAETRRHLLASSPLHFAASLPRTQLHYGEDDVMVPVVNGRVLSGQMGIRPQGCLEAFFYANAGHDLDEPAVFESSRRFLLDTLTGVSPSCR